MRFVTPLHRAYPRRSANTEVARCLRRDARGFCVSTRCASAGVPFSHAFANYVHWSAAAHEGADGATWTRLRVSAACRFHAAVWGPIRAQIERESVAGMQRAYAAIAAELGRWYRAHGGTGAASVGPYEGLAGRAARRGSGPHGGAVGAVPKGDSHAEQASSRWLDSLNLLLLSMLMTLFFRWLLRLNTLRFLEAPNWRPWLDDAVDDLRTD